MDIILFGMQGSGKGTQGKILADRYDLNVFDMGSQLRRIISSGIPLGEKIKEIVNRGDLVDDDTIMQVVENFIQNLSSPDQSLLFDGIPRTLQQSEKLLSILKAHDRNAFAVLINISEDEAVNRLTQRRICPQCKTIYPAFYKNDVCENDQATLVARQDDTNLDSIKRRIENYKNETIPVIDNFYKIDRLIKVDGEQDIVKVTEEAIEKAAYLFA